jgi:hypothetical protein
MSIKPLTSGFVLPESLEDDVEGWLSGEGESLEGKVNDDGER